jgi:hypothetical protein
MTGITAKTRRTSVCQLPALMARFAMTGWMLFNAIAYEATLATYARTKRITATATLARMEAPAIGSRSRQAMIVSVVLDIRGITAFLISTNAC